MKRYEKPYIDICENLSIEDIMFISGINLNNSIFDFDVDTDGGDEIW